MFSGWTKITVKPREELECSQQISYSLKEKIGKGTFGFVYKAHLLETSEIVAIKQVLNNNESQRELEIWRKLDHCNIVKLKYVFSSINNKQQKCLNFIMEFLSVTLRTLLRPETKSHRTLDIFYLKLYTYQIFRGLAYLHFLDICHRDISPPNLLIDPYNGVLKICDFGISKQLMEGVPNDFKVCGRYYRAPELLLRATNYTTKIDIWSAGCILAELLYNKPIFPGPKDSQQLNKIIAILGTPTKSQLLKMNPNNKTHNFPVVETIPWKKVFKTSTPEDAIDLVSQSLVYIPSDRCSPLQACAHSFFDELRQPGKKLPTGRELPPLFNFSENELKIEPSLNSALIPAHIQHCQNDPQAPIGINYLGLLTASSSSGMSSGAINSSINNSFSLAASDRDDSQAGPSKYMVL